MDSYKHSVGACQSFREMNPQTNEQTFNIFSSASFKSRAGGSGEVSKGLSVPSYFQGRCCTCWSGGLRDNSSHLLLYTPSCCSTDPQTTDQNMSWALNASRWRRWARHSATPGRYSSCPCLVLQQLLEVQDRELLASALLYLDLSALVLHQSKHRLPDAK